MNLHIVSVRDIVANVFGNPVFVNSVGGAIRSFGDEVNKKDGNPFALHPEDYELVKIGEFDPVSGEIFPAPKEALITGKMLIRVD